MHRARWTGSRRLALSAVLSLAVVAGGRPALAADDPADLIERMGDALMRLNYEGTFVHLRDGHLEAMEVAHAYIDGMEFERMLSLTGEAREVVRNDRLVTCIFPKSGAVLVSDSKPREKLPEFDVGLATNPSYRLVRGGSARVAGREAAALEIRPRDSLRYGHRLWIDRENAMLLRSVLLDAVGRPIEDMMFTSIRFFDSLPRERFDVSVDEKRITRVKPGVPAFGASELSTRLVGVEHDTNGGTSGGQAVDRIDYAALPDGYREVAETYRSMPMHDSPISHAMLSDGLASVSVYVEHMPADAHPESTRGASHMGALSAYGLSLDNAFVTAVGEVPQETVRRIAHAVRVAE